MSNEQTLTSIGVIGWGGLVVNKEKELVDLKLTPWINVGPILPLEFSHKRVNFDFRLTISG